MDSVQTWLPNKAFFFSVCLRCLAVLSLGTTGPSSCPITPPTSRFCWLKPVRSRALDSHTHLWFRTSGFMTGSRGFCSDTVSPSGFTSWCLWTHCPSSPLRDCLCPWSASYWWTSMISLWERKGPGWKWQMWRYVKEIQRLFWDFCHGYLKKLCIVKKLGENRCDWEYVLNTKKSVKI